MKNYFLYSFISITFIFFSNCKAIDILEIIDNNNITELNKIIKNGYDINKEIVKDFLPYINYTPLLYAVEKEKYEIIKLLIQNNVDLNFSTNIDSPISLAAKKNNITIIKLLLDNGADINNDFRYGSNNSYTYSAIFHAATHFNFELFDYLISRGADVNRGRLLEGDNALMAVIGNFIVDDNKNITYHNEIVKMVKKLIENGIDVNYNPHFGNALTLAAERNNEEVIELLLKNGFDVLNIVNYLEITTYEYVISLNNFRINEIISNYR